MNLNSNKKIFVTVLGVLALALHLGMSLWGTDEKGLLITAHPLAIALLAVTALACLYAARGLWGRKVSDAYADNFIPSAAAAIGCFAMAGGIAVTVISGSGAWLRLEQIRNLFGILAVPLLVVLGLKRFSGKRPFFLLHGLVCVYLTLHTISHYQIWSSTPQWLHWLFPMAASVLLTLFAYRQTAFDVDMGSHRKQVVTGLLAAFFCIGAILTENSMLYLGGAVWTLTNLCAPAKEIRQ